MTSIGLKIIIKTCKNNVIQAFHFEQKPNTIKVINMISKIKYSHFLKCLTMVWVLVLTGCGYTSDKPPANLDLYKSEKLQACKIDIDKLGDIFKENREAQIQCLKENFIQFTKYVKTNSTDSVSQGELGDFVKKIFQGQSDSVVKGLSIIFQLNMLLLRDEAQKISKGNISPLFDLLITANKEAIIITKSLQDMGKPENQGRFFQIRDTFKESVENFSRVTLKIMTSTRGQNQSLNIKDFINEAAAKLGNKDLDKDTIDTLIVLKQLLVSGQREIITSNELEQVLMKLPQLMTFSFEVYYSTNSNFNSDADQSLFYLEGLKGLYDLINFNQSDISVFNIDQILKLVKTYTKDSTTDITKFKPTLVILKQKIIGGDAENISLIDIKKILDLIVEVTEKFYFDNITYDIRKDLLSKKTAITYADLSPINASEYRIFSARRVAELTKNFNELAVEFKYFTEKSGSVPYYGVQYKRTRYGIIEQSILRFIAKKVVNSYGHLEKGERLVSVLEFQQFLLDMKPVLEELKLWSPTFKTFAQNAVLLADLFQSQSNGDLLVNEREATEYITMLLTASTLTDNFQQALAKPCDGGLNKKDPLFTVKCFNDHFYDLFLNQLNYKKQFPQLFNYVNNVTSEEAQKYLVGIEGFARDINDPKIPMNKRDTILTLGAMVNVETTFIRLDTNSDNVLDYNELLESFKIYKTAIVSLAKLAPKDEYLAQSIFLYMIVNMEVPPNNDWIDNVKFYSFHKCLQWSFCRNKAIGTVEAKRLNIGTLLYYLVNQSAPAPSLKKDK